MNALICPKHLIVLIPEIIDMSLFEKGKNVELEAALTMTIMQKRNPFVRSCFRKRILPNTHDDVHTHTCLVFVLKLGPNLFGALFQIDLGSFRNYIVDSTIILLFPILNCNYNRTVDIYQK